ncbi:MAG: type II secretion system F family protein [Phycisphaerales bacterium]
MQSFRYQAFDAGGALVAGTILAPDRPSAVRQLQDRGETPISLESGGDVTEAAATGEGASPARSARSLLGSRGRPTISRADLASLVRELATALEAGVPLLQALRTVRRSAGGPKLATILDFLIERVEAGQPLHVAAKDYGPPFDDMVVGMTKAADATGRMSEVLHQLADLLERQVELRRELVGATVYPLVVATLIGASIIVLITFVLPRIMAPIVAAGRELPLPTRILLGFANVVGTWWWVIVGGIVLAVFAWRSWIAVPANRRRFDAMLLRAPLFGRLIRDVAVARFTRTLGTLVAAGIPILTALRIVRDTLGNMVLMDAIDQVQEKVTTGQSLADPLEKCGHFPPLLIQIVNIGERSGRLEAMLLHAAGAFDRQVNTSLKIFSKALPPVLIVIMAVIAAFVLLAILLPLLEMQSAVGG